MAEFCWRCLAGGIYPEAPERNDLRGLCAEGEVVAVLCEGCGPITVDHEGKPVEGPRFEHDCEGCTFIGRDGDDDVYACPQAAHGWPIGPRWTVVRRWGHGGPEYVSGAHLLAPLPEDLRERALDVIAEGRP